MHDMSWCSCSHSFEADVFLHKQTGVGLALAQAVALKRPIFIYPVANLDTLQSVQIERGNGGYILLLENDSSIADTARHA